MTKVARGPVIKSASLDAILAANGLKTTDELREPVDTGGALYKSTGVFLTATQRRNLRKVMARAGKDIYGNQLVETK